jgi:hypothetical protein
MTRIISNQKNYSKKKDLFSARIWWDWFNEDFRRKQNKEVSSKTKFRNLVICFFEFDYERSRVFRWKCRHEESLWLSVFNDWRMIVCDDHFLNDESMLKTMLRVFVKRIIRILRLRSISWNALSFSFRKEARDLCVCVRVFVLMCDY